MNWFLFLFLFVNTHVFLYAETNIDSVLKKSLNANFSTEIKNQALSLTYNDIVNNLNKSQVIFESIHQSELKSKNQLLGEVKEKLALIYYLKGNFEKSSQMHLEAISIFDKLGKIKHKANAIGEMAYQSKKRNLKSSIRLMNDAIQLMKSLGDNLEIAALYDNYGVLHELNHQLDSATFYYELALKIKRNYLDSTGIPYSLNNLAGIYFMQNKIEKGLQCIEESNLIRQKLKDLIGISWNEYALGEFYFNQNDIVKSKIHFNKAYVYALKNSYPDLQSKILKFLSSIYAKQRKFDSAYYVFEKYNQLDDSIYNSQNQKQILELETIYETEKKSSQIKLLNSDNKLKQEELIRKNNAQRFLLLIISLVIIFLAVVIRAFYQKKKANKIILEQKTEVEFQKSEIEKQKHIVFEKQKEILDSINYAKKIQDTILANAIFLKRYLPEHFVFFQPKDIVSGDFYWATKRNNKFYLAVCDSTGHGVPGAFMSLLNIGFLNEAINEKGIELPGDVFNYVRNRLVETISKGEQKDGFDGILLCFNLTDNKITYAAANNAPILITNQKMIELPKDRMPVGKGEKDQPFKNFNLQEIIEMQKEIISINNAEIILYTDGYADQFGGPKEKKFKYKPLNEMLVANTHLSLTEQHTKLKTTFDNWKGDLEQVDDVCVVGVRI